MPLIRANGLDVHYEVEGAGPPLVMLHGATSSALEDWSAQRPAFRKAFRLYLVDARGHAGTRWDVRDGFDRDLLVDDLLGFVDALSLPSFHLIGFSMGAMTALTFATRYPERLRTAIICGIDVLREPRASVAQRLMDPERIKREEPSWAAQLERRHGPVQGEGAWENLLRAIAADVSTARLLTPEALRRTRLPVQLIYGDRDVFVPADHAVAIHRQLPDSRLLIAPNSPHQVMVSQPALFNLAAGNFYRSTEKVAVERAESALADFEDGGFEAPASAPGDGEAVFEPVAAEVADGADASDPFSEW
ncbi:MAG: alpha/beta hydrolase [Candidatus Limnocylindrales bacterium]